MKKNSYLILVIFTALFISLISCNNAEKKENTENTENIPKIKKSITDRINQFKEIELIYDVSGFSDNQQEMLRIFIEISRIIDDIFWKQNFGNKNEILNKLNDKDSINFVEINYGPWDIFDGNKSVVSGYDKKPLGANFYPKNIKYLPFINLKAEGKLSPYTLIRRDDAGDLTIEYYHETYKKELQKIHNLMLKAAALAYNKGFANYLKLRAKAMLNDKYYESDVAWMQIKDNDFDFLVGPVETRNDNFLHIKASYETFLLIRNKQLSEQAKSYAELLNDFQQCLPIDDSYKSQPLAEDIDFGVYDAIYYGGISNYGGKILSLNRPYDIQVLKKYGSRKMMFKNVMDAKLKYILMPIAEMMLDSSLLGNITSKAFTETNFLYEIGDKLGFNKTLDGKLLKETLKDYFTIIDKVRADILRLYLASELKELEKITDEELKQHYTTYLANIFRIIRFGDEIPEAKANMLVFNYLVEQNAILRNDNGTYSVDYTRMETGVKELTTLIHQIEQNGDYQKAKKLANSKAMLKEPLKTDIQKILQHGVPVDVRFKQGPKVLGL